MKVSVAVRAREEAEAQPLWYIYKNQVVSQDQSHSFLFESLFPSDATNSQLYATSFSPLVKQVIKGFSGSIVVYGEEESGKIRSYLTQIGGAL